MQVDLIKQLAIAIIDVDLSLSRVGLRPNQVWKRHMKHAAACRTRGAPCYLLQPGSCHSGSIRIGLHHLQGPPQLLGTASSVIGNASQISRDPVARRLSFMYGSYHVD